MEAVISVENGPSCVVVLASKFPRVPKRLGTVRPLEAAWLLGFLHTVPTVPNRFGNSGAHGWWGFESDLYV